MKKILFPTDYSAASTAALRYAVALARQSDALLSVVYVEPPSVPPLGAIVPPESPDHPDEAAFARVLESLAGDGEPAARYELRRLRGDPAVEILRLADAENVDLIVMATAGRSGWRRILMGSVAESIVRGSPCPVLTLKESQAPRQAVGPLPAAAEEEPQAAESPDFGDPARTLVEAGGSRALVLLNQAIEARATDVHLYPIDGDVEIRLRIDGVLEHLCRLPEDAGHHLVTQLKVMADLDISDPFHPQEAQLRIPEGLGAYEVRLTAVPVVGGQSMALRLLERGRLLRPLDSLGLSPASLDCIQRMLRPGAGEGVVLVTGPANSGKTTTAYSMVHALDDGHRNIVTIEDPPEYHIPRFRQLAADARHNVTLTSGLRTLLRMDPDIVLVGEIRDVEAAEIAMRAASSGKFVFTTLHTRDVASTITALRDLRIDNRSLAGNVRGIVSQRLVRRLCRQCRRQAPLDPEGAAIFSEEGLDPPREVFVAHGCPACRNTGYFERIGIFEAVAPERGFREAIESGGSEDELRNLIRSAGTVSLRSDALAKVQAGVTTLDELRAMTWARLLLVN
jgi:type II secretory ATPase GspE/PulE/Tfp pilus assembly ATPase PilB-like protein/nucleotide-binding universal stress UspA family protein